ncbi:uncharacterized protein LOC105207195 isoform X2 [Solenopsis invicta]|uniref:uncharacterized protein LOC105207195 isoform X2 n=1 Tax=Solenopsis invicta TaxID=13686 RepID=UPI00193CD047|nr:uncharacterized protein LOC105207195 isoform X2 [Solenopsis invicta]
MHSIRNHALDATRQPKKHTDDNSQPIDGFLKEISENMHSIRNHALDATRQPKKHTDDNSQPIDGFLKEISENMHSIRNHALDATRQPKKHTDDNSQPIDGFLKEISENMHSIRNHALDATNMQETCTYNNNRVIEDKLMALQDDVKSLIEGQVIIKEMIQKIMDSDAYNVDVNLRNTFYEGLEGFPLNTIEEFKELESDAKKDVRRKLYNHLRRLGGSKFREFLYNSIKEIMTDSLVSKFTWPGSSKSEKFGNTKTMNIIYPAQKCTLFHGPQDKASCKVEVQEVFRAIKQRYRKNLKKNQPLPHQEQLNQEDEVGEDSSDFQSEYEMTDNDELQL